MCSAIFKRFKQRSKRGTDGNTFQVKKSKLNVPSEVKKEKVWSDYVWLWIALKGTRSKLRLIPGIFSRLSPTAGEKTFLSFTVAFWWRNTFKCTVSQFQDVSRIYLCLMGKIHKQNAVTGEQTLQVTTLIKTDGKVPVRKPKQRTKLKDKTLAPVLWLSYKTIVNHKGKSNVVCVCTCVCVAVC